MRLLKRSFVCSDVDLELCQALAITGMTPVKSARKSDSALDASVAQRLIDSAEELIGTNGLEGVSLRQICLAAGTNNNYAVQYHFGDIHGLIDAILAKRAPPVERARARIFATIKARNQISSESLIGAMLRPLVDHLNDRGERALARFLLALFSTPASSRYLDKLYAHLSTTKEIFELLYKENPGIPQSLIRERLRLSSLLVMNSVFNRLPPYDSDELDTDLVDHAIAMASAAVTCPVHGTLERDLSSI
jgi:AcrR family transcriptional regulator